RTETATSSLGQVLGISGCDEDDLYAAMDWVLARKDTIENTLAARHLANGTLVLYDVSSAAFEGNTADPKTLTTQITKLKDQFGLTRVALVGDRGMLTSARITEELRPGGLDWISALRAPQIKNLVEAGALQLSLFDEQNLVEISSPDFPGERLVCCHNPVLAADRTRTRDSGATP